MVAFIALCNSACITCIWCFLLSICFPKFVKIMEDAEPGDWCAQRAKNRRESFESVGDREIKRRNGESRDNELGRRRDARRENENSRNERRESIDVFNRISRDVEAVQPDQSPLDRCPRKLKSLGSVDIDKGNRDIDFEGRETFVNRLGRTCKRSGANPNRDQGRLNGVSSGVASVLEEHSNERKTQTAKEFYCDRTNRAKCRGCANRQSRIQKYV